MNNVGFCVNVFDGRGSSPNLSSEFLTARNAIKDFANSERNIVGGDMDLCVDFVAMFEKFLQ